MAISNDDIFKLINILPEEAKQIAYDFLKSLTTRPDWDEIEKMEPDDIPLSDEELRQLNSDAGFVTGEEAKREFGLQVDLP
ncbi:MAG: hypothetical protein PHZ11_08060 [Desulfitobacteriaceae bacterium]|nr:hypothetical protein [Desulfitobacteriaceae bacterium]MDD4346822.1 hypothetical protein [Desulfitobacteriaceae bacterium]MDD4402146.1 hypothetical protein [Desulfitobacteriaceae bacterium]